MYICMPAKPNERISKGILNDSLSVTDYHWPNNVTAVRWGFGVVSNNYFSFWFVERECNFCICSGSLNFNSIYIYVENIYSFCYACNPPRSQSGSPSKSIAKQSRLILHTLYPLHSVNLNNLISSAIRTTTSKLTSVSVDGRLVAHICTLLAYRVRSKFETKQTKQYNDINDGARYIYCICLFAIYDLATVYIYMYI